MSDELTRLREEVAYLKGELQALRVERQLEEIRRHLHATPTEALILRHLYAADCKPASVPVLDAYPATPGMLKVWISNLRKKLGDGSILFVEGAGYRLTRAGHLAMQQALQPEVIDG